MRILEIHSRVNTIEEIKEVAEHFDAFYVMGIYITCEYTKELNKKYGLDPSLFAIEDYIVDEKVRKLLAQLEILGKPIIVDFIPNHIGRSYFNKFLAFADRRIGNYEWEDTYQVNYTSSSALHFFKEEIRFLSRMYNGLRFDMAHLLLQKNYNEKHKVNLGYEPLKEFVKIAKKENPNCILIAEAYQDYDTLKWFRFDYVYRIEPRRNPEILEVYDEKDLIIVDNHDEQLLYWFCNQDLEFLKEKLIHLATFDNTFWYLPAIMGYTKRPSANYWLNREWNINPKVKEIYLEILKELG